MIIAPHPDDELAGCAGTLIRHRDVGDSLLVAVVTDGAESRALPVDRVAMARLREQESRAAAESIGAQWLWLGLCERNWSPSEGRQAIGRALAEMTPTIIYAPSNIDFHPGHRRVAAALAETLATVRLKAEVRIYSVQVPLTPLLTNLVHDVSDLTTRIRSVLSVYGSQRKVLSSISRSRRYAARFFGSRGEIEAFCTVSPDTFCRLQTRECVPFRGLGIRAWTDPLALVVGVGERIRWKLALRSPRAP